MAWIESHQGLANHPKTKRLVRRLNISVPLAVGHLHCLWWWALDFAQDGEITQYDAFDIADACQWKGDVDQLHDALIEAGFIDVSDEKRYLHDWYDYAGKLIEIRRKDAERKRNSRGNPNVSSGHPADIQRTSEGVRAESIRDLNLDLNPNHNQNPKVKSVKEYRPETTDLTNHLIWWMKQNNENAKVPQNLDKWNDEMDKLERLDKYEYMQIRSAIDWCQQDSFWKSNILSVPKLREKIDTIVMQMQRKPGGVKGNVTSMLNNRFQKAVEEEKEREAIGHY